MLTKRMNKVPEKANQNAAAAKLCHRKQSMFTG